MENLSRTVGEDETTRAINQYQRSFRFKTGVPEIQLSCIKYLKSYFTNHPELQDDLEGRGDFDLIDSTSRRMH